MFSQLLGALGSGAFTTSTMSIVTSLSEDKRERNIGIHESMFGLGMPLGPMAGGLMYEVFKFKGMFFIFSIIAFVMLPWTYFLMG